MLFFLFLFGSATISVAQDAEIVKYFDQYWAEISPDSAMYVTHFKPEGDRYHVVSYYKESGALYRTSYFKHADFSELAEGYMITYYENGSVQDSSFINSKKEVLSVTGYYPDGKLMMKYSYDTKKKKGNTIGYNEKGKEIEGFIYQQEASFPGGNKEWQKFVSNAILAFSEDTPPGEYKFVIRFVIDEKGKVTDLTATTDLGFGMEASAIRALKRSPRWNPAILYNKPIKAVRMQPFIMKIAAPKGKKKK